MNDDLEQFTNQDEECENSPEIPLGRNPNANDLHNAIIMAKMLEEGRIDDGYLIKEGWDLRDLVHSVVILARAYQGKLFRTRSCGESTEGMVPADSTVVSTESCESRPAPAPACACEKLITPNVYFAPVGRAAPPESPKKKRIILL